MNLKELRQFIGWERGEVQTQRGMMVSMGRSDGDSGGSWSHWEVGKHCPDSDSLKLIAKAFNVIVTITPDGEISFDRE